MSEWEKVQLRDVVSILGDGLHGTPKYSENGEYYFINGNNLGEGKILITKETQRVSHSEYIKYKKELNDRTLFVSINGTLGNVAYYKNENLVLGKSACYFNLLESVDKDFVRYILSTPYFQKYIKTHANGSTIKNLSLKTIREFSFSLPPLRQQKQIASILSCLDAKIDNLRRQNETLEEIARSIFKHWFIDFEFPNADGKPYKSSGGAMVRSELGDIPKGWRVGKLGDVATNNSETHKFEDKDKIIFVNTGDVLDGKFLHENYMSVNTLPGQAKKRIAKHDILYSEIRPKNKHFAYINFERNLENYVVSTKFMVVRANDSILPRLLYLILKRQESIDEFNYIAESRSGTFPQITFEAVSHFQFPLPPIDIQKCLMLVFTNLMEKKEFNVIKIETLTKTRDALLPKLMSGQLRVKE